MHVYIPIAGILQFLFIYFIIGMVLYIPLAMWSQRFIAGKPSVWAVWDRMQARTVFKGMFASTAFWPIILGASIRTEIRYRKKGYL